LAFKDHFTKWKLVQVEYVRTNTKVVRIWRTSLTKINHHFRQLMKLTMLPRFLFVFSC